MIFTSHAALQRAIHEAGYGDFDSLLLDMARPCVRVLSDVVNQSDLSPTDSRIGGDPHLPSGFEWPACRHAPLCHLATIRLSEIARFRKDVVMPNHGLLHFWFDQATVPWGLYSTDRGCSRVTYLPDEGVSLERCGHPEPHRLPEYTTSGGRSFLRPCKVRFEPGVTIPSAKWAELYEPAAFQLLGDEFDVNLLDDVADSCDHHLFGHPWEIQNPMQPECETVFQALDRGLLIEARRKASPELIAASRRCQLLFQLDTDELGSGACWGANGRLYFWIDRERLKVGDFSRIWVRLQCS